MQRDITDAFLQSLPPPANGRLEIRDTRVAGLALRVTPAGVCTWTVRARLGDGKRVRPSLGRWPEISIRDARKQARIALGEIASGKDPVAEKRSARASRARQRALPTVEQRLADWRAAKADHWSSGYARDVARLCERFIIPRLGNRVLTETTRADWTAMIAADQQRRPATATWLYSITSSFAGHAEAMGWIDRPLLPRRGLAAIAPPVSPRERVLTDQELAAVWRAAEGRPPKVRAFVKLLILTGCRVSEAAGLALGELEPGDYAHAASPERCQWTIPANRAKNGHALTVPLPAALMGEILALAPGEARMNAGSSDYRLLGRRNSILQGISHIKRVLDRDCGVTGWRMHDLRRTLRTGLARLGVSNEVAEACLNHQPRNPLIQIYNRHTYVAEIRSALTLWQEHVAALVYPPPKLKVVPAA